MNVLFGTELCRPYGADVKGVLVFHGLAPVARIVLPLRGCIPRLAYPAARGYDGMLYFCM